MGTGTGGVSTAVAAVLSTGSGIGVMFSGGVTDRVGNGEAAIGGVVSGGATNTGGGGTVVAVVVVALTFFGL